MISVSDFLGRRTAINDRDGDRRQIDLRKEVNAQRLVGEQTYDSQAQDEHGRKNRTADAYLC